MTTSRLSPFQRVVLTACRDLGRGSYGRPIYDAVCAALHKDVAIPVVYLALGELEDAGMVTLHTVDTPPGRRTPRRYYHPTRLGLAVLEEQEP